MVYKSKRKTRKLYGGEIASTDTSISVQPVKPTLWSNIGKAASIVSQSINTAVDYGLNKTASAIGEDPNQTLDKTIEHVSQELTGAEKALESPAGKNILHELSELSGQVGSNIIGPALEKSAEVVVKESDKIGQQAVQAGLNVVGTIPVIGEAEEGVRVLSNVVRAGEDVVDTAAQVTGIGAQALTEAKQDTEQAQGLLSNLTGLINSGIDTVNQGVNTGLNMAEGVVGKAGEYVQSNANQISEDVKAKAAEGIKTTGIENIQKGGNQTFDEIQRGGLKAAKRAYKSQLEFLNSRITSGEIYKKQTKKNSKRRRQNKSRKSINKHR